METLDYKKEIKMNPTFMLSALFDRKREINNMNNEYNLNEN